MLIIQDETQLRQVSKPVPTKYAGIGISQRLNYELQLIEHGIGLAAPQIGIFRRVAVVHLDNQMLSLINPIYRSISPEMFSSQEGCLSFPNLAIDTARFSDILVQTSDSQFEIHAADNPLLCACIQHEVDHLFGILFQDRACGQPLNYYLQLNEKMNEY